MLSNLHFLNFILILKWVIILDVVYCVRSYINAISVVCILTMFKESFIDDKQLQDYIVSINVQVFREIHQDNVTHKLKLYQFTVYILLYMKKEQLGTIITI